jgi:hypothetical protein
MSLSQQEIKWIQDAAGVIPQIDAALDIENLKAKKLAKARDTVDKNVGSISVGENFKVEVLSDFLKMKVEMASITGDPNEEFDTGHDSGSMTEGLDKDSYTKLMHAQSIIAGVTADLRNSNNPTTNKPLFTDKEISDAIWQPLKRQKLIPENAIPDRYSEVSRTFSGASGDLELRVSAFTDSLKGNEDTLHKLGVAKEVVQTLGSVAGGIISGIGGAGDLTQFYAAEAMVKGITSIVGGSLTLAQSGVKGEFDKKHCDSIAKVFCTMAADGINAICSVGSREQGYDLGKCIAYAVATASSGPSIYAKITAKPPNYTGIIDDIGDMVIGALNAYDYEVKSKGGSDQESDGIRLNEMGMAIGGAVKGARTLIDAAVKKAKGGELTPEDLLKIMQTFAKELANTMTYVSYDDYKSKIEEQAIEKDTGTTDPNSEAYKQGKEEAETEADPTAFKDLDEAWGGAELIMQDLQKNAGSAPGFSAMDKLYKAANQGPEALAKCIKEDPACKGMEKMAALLEKRNKEIQQQALATFDQEMEESERNFRDMLNRSETGDSEKDAEAIEALLVEMKKDQMVVDLAFQIASAGGAVVSGMAGFFPPLGAVSSSIELMKNIYKAVKHFQAFAEWQDNVRDAKSAMSVQVEAMTNRMDWSGKKGADEVISALENAAKAVSSAMSLAGPFAPAGMAMSGAVTGFSALRQIITKMVREAEVKEGWKLYRSARENPEDRKLIRKAMRQNPTLSKYVIAWGAVVENDPIAKSAMKKCGLTEETLSNKNTNVSKVVTFLETMYPEDPTTIEPNKKAKWYPGKVEYNSVSFATFAGAAETNASPKLKKGEATSLLREFTRFDTYRDAAAKAQAEWQKAATEAQKDPAPDGAAEAEQKAENAWSAALDAALNSSQVLLNTLKSSQPKADGDATHAEFTAYCRALVPTGIAYVSKFKREREGIGVEAED